MTAEPLEQLKRKVKSYIPGADLGLIDRAFAVAQGAHQGQTRASGEEYLVHPVAVAQILADLQLDVPSIVGALLHDVVEDTHITLEQLEQQFGKEIAGIVDGVTKLSKLDVRSREEAQVENLRKMFLAMARDLRVVLIKLADRLHNMRTLKALPPERRRAMADETMEIYAPLAHRLGIFDVKWELEDLAFRWLEAERYAEVASLVARRREEREKLCQDLMASLREKLEEVGLRADISGRPKHLWSIFKKITRAGKDISELYDLIAIRVIVDEVKDCYGALGIIHSFWKPLPGRFKDYIATPKPNMYQSLHTTVIGPHGEPFEIQIRTWEMHRTAEYGIAAHWSYKEGRSDKEFDRKLAWLRSLLEWQQEYRDAREFVESVKVDIFADQVFVFTPRGDVVNLPAEATPLDFAYQVHTEVGHRCVGAKVNGRIVPLDSTLKSGDIVEIITSKSSPGPSLDWLKVVKTSSAKSKIRNFFKRERREESLARGKELLEDAARRTGLEAHELFRPEWQEEVARRFNFTNFEDLMVNLGFGGLTAPPVITRFKELYDKEQKRLQPAVEPLPPATPAKDWEGYRKPTNGIRVKGERDLFVRFSRCCHPVPGDPIIGYISRGRGVAVHRLDCPNVAQYAKEPDRLIEVAWEEGYSASHPVEVMVTAMDRAGLLADVATICAERGMSILSSVSRRTRNKFAVIDLVLEVKDLNQLQYVINKMRKVRDVVTVERVVREMVR